MREKDIYTAIAMKMGAPVTSRLLKILELSFSPAEGQVLFELFAPSTAQQVASRLSLDVAGVDKTLAGLVERGIITRGKTQFAFHSSLLAFHHDVVADTAVQPQPKELRDAWADFFYNEWSDIFVNSYIERQRTTGRQVHRVWPSVTVLEMSPNIRQEDILPAEDFRLVIKNAQRRIIAPCGCRGVWGTCNHAIDTCFACFDNERGRYYIDQPDRGLKELSLDETFALIRSHEMEGLVHIGVCYCCPDACEILYSLNKHDRFDLLAPSRYKATVNQQTCDGCQTCVERCFFNAIEMQKAAGAKKLKSSVVAEKCVGCGACITGCPQHAITYEIVRPPEYLAPPKNPPARPGSLWGHYDLA